MAATRIPSAAKHGFAAIAALLFLLLAVPASAPAAARLGKPAALDGQYKPPIGRSLVIGETLFTLSYAGLAANRLADLASLSFTEFAR